MKLIISEKPSSAQTIAHAVGAREKIYGEGKEYCYKGSGFYVVNARGHLYGLGLPQDYGYSKSYKLEELPIFPDFRIFPENEKADDLRTLISQLMALDEVDEIICATDAGREGELIFRQIYTANGCKKTVKRLWTNSMTDEAITECMKNLPPDSDFDGEYYAALAREKADWIIGMNLSRLYGVLDGYPHRIGRVKTPVLAIVAERDSDIERFEKSVTYRLEMENGAALAISQQFWNTPEEAERARVISMGKTVNVLSAKHEEKTINRPLLHSLTTLQQEANRVYDLTAKQTLDAAQSLYEKKLITYPRTDCSYISEDMREKISRVLDVLEDRAEYRERIENLKSAGINLDSRVVNNKKMDGHDHHAIIPETNVSKVGGLSDTERKIYGLVANRLLCAVDTEYKYLETNYEFWCEDVIYTLKTVKSLVLGWKKYDTAKEDNSNALSYCEYAEGTSFTPKNISVRECIAKPKKHFTDDTLLSVMNNIDNRIDDKELKAAVSGRGIGTEATRAEVIEQLISAGYLERQGKSIVATDFGRAFIRSVPDNVKSLERTAEWEQVFTKIKSDTLAAEQLLEEVREFVKSVIDYEKSSARERTPVECENPYSRKAIGVCPRCGKNIYEGKKNFYCDSGKEGCGFTLWKDQIIIQGSITPDRAERLLKGEAVPFKTISKEGSAYTADFVLEDTGKYINLKRLKSGKKSLRKCPRCGKEVFEGNKSYYCEMRHSPVNGREGCGFNVWKEDKYNGINITAANMTDLLNGKAIYKQKKKLNGETERIKYTMIDTGTYVNIRHEKE